MENHVGSQIVDISRPWRFAKRARAATGPVLTPRPIGPTPMWVQRLQEVLGPWAIGYAFGAAHTDIATNQTALYGYTQGLTRSWTQPSQPGKRWAADSRCNLASVSKFIAAVAIVKFLPTISKTINDTFLPLIRDRLGSSFTPGRHVDQVTIKQLLTMTSGLEIDTDLRFHGEADIWSFLRSYLHKDVTGVLDYNNTNFTVLQAIIEAQTGGSFVDWLRQNVLKPMGIDIDDEQAFSATPDPEGTATLAYRDATDHRVGQVHRTDPGRGRWWIDHLSRVAAQVHGRIARRNCSHAQPNRGDVA